MFMCPYRSCELENAYVTDRGAQVLASWKTVLGTSGSFDIRVTSPRVVLLGAPSANAPAFAPLGGFTLKNP